MDVPNYTDINLAKWPGPVIGYDLKQIHQINLIDATKHGDTKTQTAQGCKASFYLGEDALALKK